MDAARVRQSREPSVRTVCVLYGCQCRACCERVERAVRRVAGVRNAEANLYKATLTVEHDDTCTCRDIVAAVERIGYLAEIAPGGGSAAAPDGNDPPGMPRGPLPPRIVRPPPPPAPPPLPGNGNGGTING